MGQNSRRAIAALPLSHAPNTLQTAACLDNATYRHDRKIAPEDLIAQADQFPYQAKQEGRSRMRHPQPESPILVSSEARQELSALFGRPTRKKDSS